MRTRNDAVGTPISSGAPVSRPRRRRLRVLFAASECAPWVKTGGLGDVAGALTAQLRRDGHDVRVLMPAYRSVRARLDGRAPLLTLAATAALPEASLVEAKLPGDVPAWLVDCPSLYDRDGGPYQDAEGRDWRDNPVRFALLSRVAATLSTASSPLVWRPDVLHCNDWQTGPAPALVHHARGPRAKTLMTVHNLAFQGVFDGDLTPLLGLPPEAFGIDGVEFYGRTSFLKAGLMFADRLSTVSPTYASEIQRAPLGFGLEGVLAKRSDRLSGILNGIDEAVWNPARDPLLEARYDSASLEDKARNKAALQRAMRLDVRPDLPLFGVVSRLTAQKGSDLIAAIAPRIAALPAQLAVLGTGDREVERTLLAAAATHRGAVATIVGFDEHLAHRIEGGADAFLMPSRFEPCGLNQMYSQRYGTPPIAHATGGLRDSIVDATPATLADGTATGFLFEPATVEGLFGAMLRALDVHAQPLQWRAMQRAGMAKPFGWPARARDYALLYRDIVASPASA
jgi:starch synthase